MKFLSLTLAAAAAFLVAGCASDGDPRSGGLFGYSPKAYEQRLQDREDRLADLEDEEKYQSQRKTKLQGDLKSRQAEEASLRQQVNRINTRSRNLDGKLKGAKSSQAGALAKRNANLRSRAAAADQMSDLSAKEAEIKRLRRELEELEREADALSW